MTLTKILTTLALIVGLSTQTYARNDANATKIDPKVLAKARANFVKKLGSKTGEIKAKEIKEGFVFENGKNKITLLILWSKDCESCLDDIPNLNRYLLDFRGKLNIIAIELSGMSSQELQQYAKEKKILYTIVSGKENKALTAAVMKKFDFDPNVKEKSGLPFQVVLGYTGHNNGVIRGVAKDPAEMEKFLIKVMDHYDNKLKASKASQKTTKTTHKGTK